VGSNLRSEPRPRQFVWPYRLYSGCSKKGRRGGFVRPAWEFLRFDWLHWLGTDNRGLQLRPNPMAFCSGPLESDHALPTSPSDSCIILAGLFDLLINDDMKLRVLGFSRFYFDRSISILRAVWLSLASLIYGIGILIFVFTVLPIILVVFVFHMIHHWWSARYQ